MDEETLEAAIATYGAQLQQVETALSAGLDPSQQADLIKLKDDLCQLIELTEASLVSVKKSQLLASLEQPQLFAPETATDSGPENSNLNSEFDAFYSELGEGSGSGSGGVDDEDENTEVDEVEEEDEEDALGGTKVRAPYRTTWGTLEYHNAMVVGGEPADGEETQVRVLYLYPTQKSMKPCPFYLEDKCRFPDNCRFSHGEVVYVSELREFMEFDLGHLEEGSSCLARHEDGIWYPAKIQEINNGFYTVKFDSLLIKDTVLEADAVIPPLREDDALSSDSDQEYDEDDLAYAKVMDAAGESAIMVDTSNFGGWEAHTRGIGSKLMLKMGYEYGKGLGKKKEGRVEPVMAVVLPKGKSLDECADFTQRRTKGKAAKDSPLTGRPKKRRKPRAARGGQNNVFDFLNHKLGGGGNCHTEEGAAATSTATGVEAYTGAGNTKKNLNVKVFQAAQRVSQTEKEIHRLSEALRRHTGGLVLTTLQEKLSAAHKLLAHQKAQELSIQREHKKADTHRKMTEF
uniref:Zinc finger CCCH-type with G patch domain-containing protein n=1 Tax=Cynoglossus semilaevis TaxID=244447 RepID=A0A3P8UNU1_CYNSE